MSTLNFLNDEACREVVARMAVEATRVWAPDEVKAAAGAANAYVDLVLDEGELLYLQRSGHAGYGMGEDLWVTFLLPVLVGFLGNLLASAGVATWQAYRSKLAASRTGVEARPGSPGSVPPQLHPTQLRAALAPEAAAVGLSAEQIDRLAHVIAGVLLVMTAAETETREKP